MVINKTYISEKIKTERVKAGYTQEEFAERIGITPQHFSCIELGKSLPSLPVFLNIAEVLNLTLRDFGLNSKEKVNEKLDKFTKLLCSLNDAELDCYYNIMQNLIKNFESIKKTKAKKI